jgi:hypothetical protein
VSLLCMYACLCVCMFVCGLCVCVYACVCVCVCMSNASYPRLVHCTAQAGAAHTLAYAYVYGRTVAVFVSVIVFLLYVVLALPVT